MTTGTSDYATRHFDESNQHTRRVFIGQGVVHIDWEHQQNKPDKGFSEKTESNKREHAREGTILKDMHIRKNILTPPTS
jgi:hypothetical protein